MEIEKKDTIILAASNEAPADYNSIIKNHIELVV
jgi:hypothetical protein